MNCRWTRPALGGGLIGTLLFVAGLASAQNPPQGVPYPTGYTGPVAPIAPPVGPAWQAPPAVVIPPAGQVTWEGPRPPAPPGPPSVLPSIPDYPRPPNTGFVQPGPLPVQPSVPPPPGLPPGIGPMGPMGALPPMGPMPMGPMGMLPGQPDAKGDKATIGDGKDDGKKEEPKKDATKPGLSATWENGAWFRSENNRFVVHFGGTVHYDAAFYQAGPLLQLAPPAGVGPFNDGANMRRARIFTEGTLYDAVDFKFELEFMNGIGFSPAGTTGPITATSVTNNPGPTDAWINIKDVPFFGNIRIGSQKEWFSLEHLNVYRYLEFMERSYLFDFSQITRFDNGFNPGISAFRTWANDRIFSAIGVYKNDSDLIGFGLGDGQYAVTGRLATTPIYEPDDHYFWHIGGAMSHRDPVNGTVQISVRDNIRNAPFPLLNLLINTAAIPCQSQNLYNLETAAVWGPLTFQAEYTANVLTGASPAAGAPAQGNLFFQGFYAEMMCFLTGESRTWNAKNFFFNRVNVLRPLRLKPSDCDGYGCGAWEVAVRYSYLDMSNKFVQAGRLDSVTLGLNWYLNSNAKLQWNYDLTHRGDTNEPGQGTVHAFGMRCAFDF
jgi:phosphate-selective porin OprO/OprP